MLDYIIVGLGLAGTAFCESLRKNNKKFMVFNDCSQTSSRVAGGLSNPVVLKRFTLAWQADILIPIANDFYSQLEVLLDQKLIHDLPVYRRFASVEEQNMWFEAADKKQLKEYLSANLVRNDNTAIMAPYDFGCVLQARRLDTKVMLKNYGDFLQKNNLLVSDSFKYDQLQINPGHVVYTSIKAKHIVFAEGFGLSKNPFFNYLPMQGSKGEYLTIRSERLKENNAIKSSIFVIPLGNDLYKVGANYDRNLSSNAPTEKTKQELINKLDALLDCDYEIVYHEAGIRPTVKDRKPLVGQHPLHKNLFVLNGFGSHGIMIGPWAAEQLFCFIEKGIQILPDANVKRYMSYYKNT